MARPGRGRRGVTPLAASAPVVICGQTVAGSATSRAFNVATATSAGDTILLIVVCNSSSAGVTGVTDSKGNVYTIDQNFATSPTLLAARSPGATGGSGGGATAALTTSDTWTVTCAAVSMNVTVYAVKVTGVGAFDVGQFGSGTSTTATASATSTVANDTYVALATHAAAGGAPSSYNAPFTMLDQRTLGQIDSCGYLLDAGAAGAETAAYTLVSAAWRMYLWAFKPAGPAPVTGTGAIASKKIAPAASGTVSAPPAITTASLATGTVGQPYSQALAATGASPFVWAASGLPAGLGLAALAAKANTFEGGASGSPITPAGSGGASGDAFDAATAGSGATCAFDNTHARGGSLAMLFASGATSANAYTQWNLAGLSQIWARFYLYLSGRAPANARIWGVYSVAPVNTVRCFLRYRTGGELVALDASSTVLWTSLSPLPLGQWVRVEVMVVGDAAAGQMAVRYYTSPEAAAPFESWVSAATLNTGGPLNSIAFGLSSAVANMPQTWYDDVAVSTVGPLGPVGSGASPISGTPSAAGTPSVGLTVTDSTGGTASASLPLAVVAPVTGTGALTTKKVSLAGSGTVGAGGATGTGAIKAKKIALAGTGAVQTVGTGALTAKKIALAGTGTYAGPVTGTGAIKAKKIALAGTGVVGAQAPTITTPYLADATAGIPYLFTLSAAGASPPYTWTASGLPAGLTCSAAGVLAGTTNVAGLTSVGVTCRDSLGVSSSATYSLMVSPAPVPTLQAAPDTTLLPVTWAGVNLNEGDRDDGLCVVVTDVQGWYGSPALNGNDLARALTDGALFGTKVVGPRVVTILGAAVIDDSANRDALVGYARELAALAAAHDPADLVIDEGYLSDSGEVTLAASVRADSDQLALAWLGRQAFTYQLALTAADSRLYEAAWRSVVLNVAGGATGRAYPWIPPRYYAAGVIPNAANLGNPGEVPAPVWATYSGPLGAGSQLTDGARTIYLGALVAGEVVTVETATLTAYAAGGASRASYVQAGSQPLTVSPGGATWHLYATGSGSVELNWRGAFA